MIQYRICILTLNVFEQYHLPKLRTVTTNDHQSQQEKAWFFLQKPRPVRKLFQLRVVIISLHNVTSQAFRWFDSNETACLIQTCEFSFWFLHQRQKVVDLVVDIFFSHPNVGKLPYTPENWQMSPKKGPFFPTKCIMDSSHEFSGDMWVFRVVSKKISKSSSFKSNFEKWKILRIYPKSLKLIYDSWKVDDEMQSPCLIVWWPPKNDHHLSLGKKGTNLPSKVM